MTSITGKMVQELTECTSWEFAHINWNHGEELMEIALDHQAFKQLMNDESSTYDVIITEPYFFQEPLVAFGYKFNAPVVGIYPMHPPSWASYLMGIPNTYSFIPSIRTDFSDHMTLIERVHNALLQFYEFVGYKLYFSPRQDDRMRRKIVFKGSENLPPLDDMLKNVSIHLIDSHYSSTYNRPYENNIFQVGGLTMARLKTEPLDKELSDLMDKSNGVIFFSLGGWVKASTLGEEAISGLMKAFGELKEHQVLMKWDLETPPPGMPKNVKVAPWFPQLSVLGHPKTKLFIGHGGLHGLMETIYHGVPFIGIPQFTDQEFNTRFAVIKGLGLRIGNDELTADNIQRALKTILTDPSYKETALRMSRIERDRIMDPFELAMYGIEYVIRHKGAYHLRPAVLDVSWYQFLLLDVFAVVFVIPLIVLYVMFKISKIILFQSPLSWKPREKSHSKPKK